MNIIMNEPKGPMASNFEVDSQDLHLQSKIRTLRAVDSVRIGLTVVALCTSIAILGVSADTLAVYDQTHVPGDFLLPLWPDEFDIRPTIALVVGSAVILVINAISLTFHKVQFLRTRATLHTPQTFAAPFLALAAAVIAMAFFYVINESTTVDTLQSWTCRWSHVFMTSPPHFGTLCSESQAGLYMAVLLIPLEAITFAVAAYQAGIERHIGGLVAERKSVRASPDHTLRHSQSEGEGM